MENKYVDQRLVGKSGIIRNIGSLITILFSWMIIGLVPAFFYVVVKIFYNYYTGNGLTFDAEDFEKLEKGGDLVSFSIIMSQFVFLILGILLAVVVIHKRPFRTIITPYKKINFRIILFSVGLYFILSILSNLVEFILFQDTFRWVMDINKILIAFPVIFILIMIQTSAEELFFRGYIIQGLSGKIKSVIIMALINGIIFTLPHIPNSEVVESFKLSIYNGILTLSFYFMFAFLLTFLTIKTNSLEIALGVHFMNNFYLCTVIEYEISELKLGSTFVYSTNFNTVFMFFSQLLISIIFYIVIMRFMKRFYPERLMEK